MLYFDLYGKKIFSGHRYTYNSLTSPYSRNLHCTSTIFQLQKKKKKKKENNTAGSLGLSGELPWGQISE